MISGAAYLANSLALLLVPRFAALTFPLLIIPFVAESALCLWLLIKGVNVATWDAKGPGSPSGQSD